MSDTAEHHDPKHLLDIISEQNKVIEKLLAERDELRALLEANGEKLDALTCLQRLPDALAESTTTRRGSTSAFYGVLTMSGLQASAPRCMQ
jgi:hypothetical protein